MKESWNNIKNLFTKLKDLITLGTGNVVGTLIVGVFWFYIASLVGTEGYGEISYFLSIAGIAYIVAMFGTGNTIIVYTSKGCLYYLSVL